MDNPHIPGLWWTRFWLLVLFLGLWALAYLPGFLGYDPQARYEQNLRAELQTQIDQAWLGEKPMMQFEYLHSAKVLDEMLGKANGNARVEQLVFKSCDFTTAGISQLTDLPNVTRLYLKYTPIDDEGLRSLAEHLQGVETLTLENGAFTDDGVEALTKFPRLRSLVLWNGNAEITDACLESLGRIKTLEELTLLGDWFSQEAVNKLRQELPNCRIEIHVEGYESRERKPPRDAKAGTNH